MGVGHGQQEVGLGDLGVGDAVGGVEGDGAARGARDVVGADAVLGGPSTALINLSAMFGANVVWVSEPSLTFLDTDVSEAQRQIFAAFLGRPVRPVDVAARLA